MSYVKNGKKYVSLEDVRVIYNADFDTFHITSSDSDLTGQLNVAIKATSGNGVVLSNLMKSHDLPVEPKKKTRFFEERDIPKSAKINDILLYKSVINEINNLMLPVGLGRYSAPVYLRLSGDHAPNSMITGEDRHVAIDNILTALHTGKVEANVYLHSSSGKISSPFIHSEHVKRSTNQFELLENLRGLLEYLKYDRHSGERTIFILDGIDNILSRMKINDDSAVGRTNRAVRAEILSTIMDLSRVGSSISCHFIFLANRLDSSSNGIMETVHSRVAWSKPDRTTAGILFEPIVNELGAWDYDGYGYCDFTGLSEVTGFFRKFDAP